MVEIELKSVRDLLGMKFFIPSYQRGYRWTESQITALLNDISTFDKSKDGSFYCLQPLVVKLKEEPTMDIIKSANSIDEVRNLLKGSWTVIDGQQRLTTIYLILKVLNGNDDTFEIEYERRSYIKQVDKMNAICNDNIEIYHLTNAKKIINDWLNPKTTEQKKELQDKILQQTKFIFHNVGNINDDEEHDLFNNLNSGKISLTNAELIKALFLNKVGYDSIAHREVEQRILADEFDQIERTLRQDDFWYFLAGNVPKPSSCINLLFDLMLNAESDAIKKKYPPSEPLRTFLYFNDKINEDKTDSYTKSKDMWEEVRRVFYIMEGWYNDSIMYNLIGYHRAAIVGKGLAEIYNLFNVEKSKLKFKNRLVDDCKNYIDYKGEGFLQLRYDNNYDKVFNLLLLFNISTLNERPKEAVKFSFANLHTYNWNVEHISPQNPKDDVALKKTIEKFRDNEDLKNLSIALENGDKNTIEKERAKFFAVDDNELMGIQNLTLLTEHDNKGIGNKFFFEKRQKLKEYYKKGSFIPACSMNVFMKFYSENPQQQAFWDEADRNSYKDIIKQTIKKFFGDGK